MYGGTLGQLAIPAGIAVAFWARRDAVGCAVMGFWYFENFLNIARYMADARAQVLPLVGCKRGRGGAGRFAQILKVVPRGRIELPTRGFSDLCSTD